MAARMHRLLSAVASLDGSHVRRSRRFLLLLVGVIGQLSIQEDLVGNCFTGATGSRPRRACDSTVLAASRRDVLLGTGAGLATDTKPVCEVPMRRLSRVQGQVGGQFVSIGAVIQGESVELMLDSGLSEALVTPDLARRLRLRSLGSAQGEAAGGAETVQLVEVTDVSLACGEKLPPLKAAVTSFPQEAVDTNVPLSGMLGFQAFQGYDAEFDFSAGKLRLWRPGAGVAMARAQGMREVQGVLLPELGILGIRVMQPGSSGAAAALGIVDTGAAFSAMNDAAARSLRVSPEPGVAMMVMGVDGRPLKLPLAKNVKLPLGGAQREAGGWETAVTLATDATAVGNLPALAAFVGDESKPCVLLGLDVLSQRRILFASGDDPRKQLLFVDAK
ncbi:RAB6A [Symbiodinium natans]|uniref:RAB6A protein n=1 Tax=Symbiodinium natans TaxID=878477 RepID=A0A812KHU4_9DINO|nr:RAB6A [Symbiodinium natans]